MSLDGNPFLDPDLLRGSLYANADRLRNRTGSLLNARISGRPATIVIVELIEDWHHGRSRPNGRLHAMAGIQPVRLRIADIGCGRGSSTLALAGAFPQAELIAIDLSPALLATTRQRLEHSGCPAAVLCADFHQLPLDTGSCDVIIAAFCLYHASNPSAVITEIARCLTADGIAVLATKSIDSYRELDLLVARSGLDPAAATRPSLYTTAHSTNLRELAGVALDVVQLIHEEHAFGFGTLTALASYLITTPKYALPEDINDATQLTAALHERLPEQSTTLTSTVTYLIGRKPQSQRSPRPQ